MKKKSSKSKKGSVSKKEALNQRTGRLKKGYKYGKGGRIIKTK